MRNNYEHIIWDWNGTLFNDLELCVELINEVLTKRNKPPLTVKQYQEIFTFPVKNYYEKAGLDFSLESFESLGKEWMDNYERRKHTCGMNEGAIELLTGFRKSGKTQSILSAYKQDSLLSIVSNLGLEHYFRFIIGLNNIYAAGKTALGRELMEQPELRSKKTLLIGDTLHDCEVAEELGIDCVLVSCGHQDYTRLSEAGKPVFTTLKGLQESVSL